MPYNSSLHMTQRCNKAGIEMHPKLGAKNLGPAVAAYNLHLHRLIGLACHEMHPREIPLDMHSNFYCGMD